MNKNINGKKISEILYKELNNYLNTKDKIPSIVSIRIGNNYASNLYSTMIKKTLTKETNIKYKEIYFENITLKELKEYIEKINKDEEVTGIILIKPLPDNLKEYEQEILDTINKDKDIEGVTSINTGLLNTTGNSMIPTTALGIETLLKAYDISLEGNKVAIINRSNIIGKPLSMLMLRNNATPIICHSKIRNLQEITSNCDIVIAALNEPEYITSSYIKEGAIVIDVGVHKTKENKIIGDVNYNDVINKVSLITPPINSIGPMTICMIAYNSVKAIYGIEADGLLENAIDKAKTTM